MSRPRHLAAAWSLSLAAALAAGGASFGDADKHASVAAFPARATALGPAGPRPVKPDVPPRPLRLGADSRVARQS